MAEKKFKKRFVIDAYELSKQGFKETRLAKTLGISVPTLRSWKQKKEVFKIAVKMGKDAYKGRGKHSNIFRDYVYNQLSKSENKLWGKLQRLQTSRSPKEKIELLIPVILQSVLVSCIPRV